VFAARSRLVPGLKRRRRSSGRRMRRGSIQWRRWIGVRWKGIVLHGRHGAVCRAAVVGAPATGCAQGAFTARAWFRRRRTSQHRQHRAPPASAARRSPRIRRSWIARMAGAPARRMRRGAGAVRARLSAPAHVTTPAGSQPSGVRGSGSCRALGCRVRRCGRGWLASSPMKRVCDGRVSKHDIFASRVKH
jgi:hypothetical protein